MREGPLEQEHRRILGTGQLAEPFPPGAAQELLKRLRRVTLDAGEELMHQGDAGDEMYVVLTGRVVARVEHASGGSTDVNTLVPGDVVGEMALLTGQPRSASVVAIEPADLARLTRADFEDVAAAHPDALELFLHRLLPRLRRTQMIRVVTELFGALDNAALDDLEANLEWTELRGGATLFREGDAGDDVYIVVNGRLRVVVADAFAPGGSRVLEEVGRGRAVGELALLTGESRAATVIAVRDTDLLRLPKRAFDAMLDRHPRAMLQIARAAAWRLRRGPSGKHGSSRPATLALVPAGDQAPVAMLARRLVETLSDGAGCAIALGSDDVDRRLARPGIAQSRIDDPVHESIVAWLDAVERQHDHLVLVADATDTPWTRRCVRQADRLFIVGRAGDDPRPGALERSLRDMGLTARCELVLLHPDTTARPSGTAAWLATREVAGHHHLRPGDRDDVRRFARRASARPMGLVLGGGGARGFAHIGALRALAEADIDVDVVGGSSIGAVIAGAHALGLPVEEMTSLARAFASRSAILDRTLPVVALMKGRKVTSLYQRLYGDVCIEDLWKPYFALSSGLTRAEVVLHDRGPLWYAARASTAVPAIFPPIIADDHEVLVDGNVMNNMPLDVMRAWCEHGPVIGVNPMPIDVKLREYHCGPSVSGWEALRGRWKLFGSKTRAPGIFGAVMRATEINSANRMRQPAFRALADLLIEPPVGDYPIMEYGNFAPIIEAGYRAASEALERWPRRAVAASAAAA